MIINPAGIIRNCLGAPMLGNRMMLLLLDRLWCDGILVYGLVITEHISSPSIGNKKIHSL